mmetsp:Transcript_75808/g.175769  ORF Transcript_75808/g.175769 Transcript_75808/m.175769 type:complete len:439 (-) Transcript_75808:73-1389(-)
MKTGQTLDQHAIENLLQSRTGPLAEIYKITRRCIFESHQERRYGALWAQVAPSGNIYRHLAFRLEEGRHNEDLNKQLLKLAEEHKALLGGDEVALKERAKRLYNLLGQVKQQGLEAEEKGLEIGFPPLQEFIDDPSAGGLRSSTSDKLLGLLVCVVQLISPFLIILHNWFKDSNQLRNPAKLASGLTLREFMCLGKDWAAGLTTVMGTIMLLVINTIILKYAQNERDNAQKTSLLPLDSFWVLLGNFTNAFCCLGIALAIPLELWSEDGPTGIIMDAMALLFVFSLDDLTSEAFSYLGKDESFQRDMSWYYALLSSCPVQLQDIINPIAKSAEELWQVRYDPSGRLQVATLPSMPCTTRIFQDSGTESTPLMKKEADLLPAVIRYQVHPNGPACHIPGWRSRVLEFMWTVIEACLRVILVVVPLVWFVVNKPCTESVL